tara:strand:+ start:793 stop:2241 length:1449 start_codon:yes stop_codon:yes gene_type:complete
MTKARTIADLGTGFVNISDSGTEGLKLPVGTTAQRGSTEGQFRYNSETNSFEGRNNSEFIALESAVSLSSISPTNFTPSENTNGSNNLVLTGTGFVTGAVVSVIGNDGTSVNASSTTVNSATQITAVIPTLNAALEPFDIKVTNASGNTAQLDNNLVINTNPVWSTSSGTLATVNDLATGTHATVAATDADGETITYSETTSVLSGAGLTLNTSNGQISGDPTNVNADTTYSFTLGASDGTQTVTRDFNIIVNKALDGTTASRAAASASAIKTLTSTTTNGGYYIIDPSDSSNAIYAYCDMNFDGGGWILAHSSRASTWDGQSGDQSYNNYYDTSHIVEYTSGTPYDIYSKLRTNYSFSQLLIQWTSASDMTGATDATRPVYNMAQTYSHLLNIHNNTQHQRKSGNTGTLPTSGYAQLGAYNNDTLYHKLAPSSDDRNYVFSNHTNSNNNQGGFYGWSGVHNSYSWASSPNQTVNTVAFYIK